MRMYYPKFMPNDVTKPQVLDADDVLNSKNIDSTVMAAGDSSQTSTAEP